MGLLENGVRGIVLMADPRVLAVPVEDNGEGLVDARARGLRVSSMLADAAGAFAHVRGEVADRLVRAGSFLPDGMQLLIFEGYRPVALQAQFFADRLGLLRKANPDADQSRLRMMTSWYVSPPEIAPHSAGAAVDLTLCTDEGRELNLGTPYDATPEESGGACFTDHPGLDEGARRNRAILAGALGKAGLINYPTEWWHWSYGDRYWALATGAAQAIYGPYEMP